MSVWSRLRDSAAALVGTKSAPTGMNHASASMMNYPTNWFQRGMNLPQQTGGGSVVEACVQAYAQTIAQLPGKHYELDNNGTKTYITGSRLARVLAKPNGFQTRSDFLLNLVYSILHYGNGYWVGNAVGNERPNEIFLLDPRVTQAHRVPETGDVYYSTSGAFMDMVNDEIMEGRALIPERFVGHVRLHTPHDPLIGVTPLQNAAASVGAHTAITQAQAAFFTNMSRPSGFISTDLDLTKEQMQQLREAWEEKSKDLNAGGVSIMGNGMKWNPMVMSSQDSQLVEAWRMTVEDISRVFRVPPMLINNLENSTFDNAETLMRFWLSSGLGFMINHIELAMAAYYRLDDRSAGVELNQQVLLNADMQRQMEALGAGVTKGLMAPNEGRNRLGLGPVEGGDMPLVQQQMVPVNMAASGEASGVNEPAPEPEPEPEPINEAALSDFTDAAWEKKDAA